MDTTHIADSLKFIGPLISALVYFLQSSRQFQSIGRGRAKEYEALDFVSSFLAFDIDKRNRLVVEHAFEIYLRYRLSYLEISALLRLNNPLTSTRLYIKAKQHIAFNPITNTFGYKVIASTKTRRAFLKAINFGGYFVFSLIGLSLFFYFPEIIDNIKPVMYFPLVFVIFVLLFMSFLFLRDASSMTAAEQFIQEVEYSMQSPIN